MKTNQKVIKKMTLLALVIGLLSISATLPIASATSVTFNKQSAGSIFTVGQEITFTASIDVKTDVGGSQVPITNLNITDTLPDGLTYVAGSQTSNPVAASFTAVGQVLTWRWTSSLSGSPQATVTFRALATSAGSKLNRVSAEYLENGVTYSNPSTTASVTVNDPPPSTPTPTLPPPPSTVGGETVPMNLIQVLSPYLVVAALGAVAVVTLALYKKKPS
jgi:uncharacterized repeat protein (TIGR01451 family)